MLHPIVGIAEIALSDIILSGAFLCVARLFILPPTTRIKNDCAGQLLRTAERGWELVAFWLCRGLGLLIAAQVWWPANKSLADLSRAYSVESHT